MEERTIALPGGLILALKCWGVEASCSLRALCFHGWMDNAASFDEIAPVLVRELNAFLVCVDFAGHGRSQHRDPSSFYSSAEYFANALEVWHELKWGTGKEPTAIIGHSLGAGCATMLCAALAASSSSTTTTGTTALPSACVLIDGLGIYPRPLEDTVGNFARSVTAKKGYLEAPRSIYLSVEAMAQHRVAAVSRNPGKQWISLTAARRLVERASAPATKKDVEAAAAIASPSAAAAPAGSGSSGGESGGEGAAAGGFVFVHDPRIKGPAPHYWSEDQAREFLKAIACPVLHIEAVDGWPRPKAVVEERLALMAAKRDFENVVCPGSHHLHADPETAGAVSTAVVEFLKTKLER